VLVAQAENYKCKGLMPMPMTIDSVVRWWSKERPDQRALSQSGDAITYAELDEWVGRMATRLVAEQVGIGDRVCIFAGNSLEWCVACLATLRVGGIVAGINARMVPAEVGYLVGDYAPVVLLADETGAARFAELDGLTSRTGEAIRSPNVVRIEEITALRHGERVDVERTVDPDAPAVIVTTSGSTARPKGVMYSNHSIIDHVSAFALEDPLNVQPATMYIVAPFNTSAGGVLFLHILLQGGTGFFEPQFDPERALRTIEDERIAIFCAAPIFLQRIADLPRFATADISCVEISITGGAAVAPVLLNAWADKGVLVRQMYGQTETGGWGISNPRRYALSDPERCGRGGPTRDIGIIDASGQLLPHGREGQIVMRGPGTMLGYWNDPDATAATLVDGWLRTGDIGVIDDRGLLKFVDRMKDIIISGGLNISAAEVERVLSDHPGVDEVAVFAAPDEKFGETPFAVVHGDGSVTVAGLVEHCNANLSGFKVPRYVVLSDEPLPRLATGKISKPALRSRYLDGVGLPPRVR
jgi:fatty-acyl-CoA synthase